MLAPYEAENRKRSGRAEAQRLCRGTAAHERGGHGSS